MDARWTLRVARPTDQLDRIGRMYVEGLGFEVLATFVDHDGFDGLMLGRPGEAYHLEFTTQRGHVAGRAPTEDHLLVFYVADRAEWRGDGEQSVSSLSDTCSRHPVRAARRTRLMVA